MRVIIKKEPGRFLAAMAAGMRGTQISSTIADGTLTKQSTANSVSGASMA